MEVIQIKFEGKLDRIVYSSKDNDYKVCGFKIDKNKFPKLVRNKYGNVTLIGDMPSLDENSNTSYNIVAMPEQTKYGISYKVVSLLPRKPTSDEETLAFLHEILTPKQAKTVFRAYPNIVDMLIENPEAEIDVNRLSGIGEQSLKRIREKIVQNYIFLELINEYSGLIKLSVLTKMYEKYKSVEKVRSEVKRDPYKTLCGLSGISFKTADKIICDMNNNGYDFGYDIVHSVQRCISYIHFRLQEEQSNGATYIKVKTIIADIRTHLPECNDVYLKALKDDSFQLIGGEILGVAVKSTYKTEKYIADKIKAMLSTPVEESACINYEDYRNVRGSNLTDDQLKIVSMAINNKVCILNGAAGTGKSFATFALIQALEDLDKSYILMSPTGKAAKVLAESTMRHASTIHRALGCMPPEWMYNEENPLYQEFVIVDEMSMVDINLFKHLLEALNEKAHLVMIGDPNQLPSVGCGNVLYDLLNCGQIPTVTLDKVFRYGEGGLMKVATDVRNAQEYLPNEIHKVAKFGENEDYVFIESDDVKDVLALYQQCIKKYDVESVQVLTAYKVGNTGTIELNRLLQSIANPKSRTDKGIEIRNTKYCVGDTIVQNVNNYHACVAEERNGSYEILKIELMIANGETGTIVTIKDDTVFIRFDDGLVAYDKEQMTNVSLGYALTIHKSQGSSIPVVIAFTPRSQSYMLSSNLIYVALTRTTKQCYHVGQKNTIDKAVHKKENMKRNTLLNLMMNGEVE